MVLFVWPDNVFVISVWIATSFKSWIHLQIIIGSLQSRHIGSTRNIARDYHPHKDPRKPEMLGPDHTKPYQGTDRAQRGVRGIQDPGGGAGPSRESQVQNLNNKSQGFHTDDAASKF